MLDQLFASALGQAAAASMASTATTKTVDPDAILARLAVTAWLYAEPCPFRPGEFVTPRVDGKTISAGEPHVVIEVLDGEAPLSGTGDSWSAPIVLREPTAAADTTASPQFGQVLDMRIAVFMGKSVAAYVVESQDFEAWTPEHETAWRANLAAASSGPKQLSLSEAIADLRDRAAGKEVKADWKESDTVEIVPEPRGAEAPMPVEGLHVGIVRKVDPSDGTTNVTYHAASTGKIGNAWMRNADLKKWGPKPAPVASAPSMAEATA